MSLWQPDAFKQTGSVVGFRDIARFSPRGLLCLIKLSIDILCFNILRVYYVLACTWLFSFALTL